MLFILVAHHLRDLVDFQAAYLHQFLGFLNPVFDNVIRKGFIGHGFKKLAEIRWVDIVFFRNQLQGYFTELILFYIGDHIINDFFPVHIFLVSQIVNDGLEYLLDPLNDHFFLKVAAGFQ